MENLQAPCAVVYMSNTGYQMLDYYFIPRKATIVCGTCSHSFTFARELGPRTIKYIKIGHWVTKDLIHIQTVTASLPQQETIASY